MDRTNAGDKTTQCSDVYHPVTGDCDPLTSLSVYANQVQGQRHLDTHIPSKEENPIAPVSRMKDWE